jgi:hypothetical protein
MEALDREPIQGHVLKLDGERDVALYRCSGTLWVADFVDDRCEILEAAAWFAAREGAQALAQARRHHRPHAEPISPELAETIACLHFIFAPEGRARLPAAAQDRAA